MFFYTLSTTEAQLHTFQICFVALASPTTVLFAVHFTSSRHPLEASVSAVHNGVHFPSFSSQPQSEGLGRNCFAINACPQMWPAWLQKCCS